MKCDFIIHSSPEIYPGEPFNKNTQRALRCARQQNGHHAPGWIADMRCYCHAHFLIFPLSKTAFTKENGNGFALIQSPLKFFLPGRTRNEIPLIQPDVEAMLIP